MAFIVVEWCNGGVSLVNKNWLTPMKKEAFWPPFKEQKTFNKELKKLDSSVDTETWKLHGIRRCMYETDNFEKAHKKWKQAEDTSNLDSDSSEVIDRPRKRVRNKKFSSPMQSETDEDQDDIFSRPLKAKCLKLERPPRELYSQSTPSTSNTCESEIIHSIRFNDRTSDLPLSKESEESNLANLTSVTPVVTPKRNCYLSSSNINSVLPSSVTQNDSLTFFEKKVISLLAFVKNQNEEILLKLSEQRTYPQSNFMPELPVTLPLKTLEELRILEDYLKDSGTGPIVSYLSSLGGRDTTSKTNRILKTLLTDEVASLHNFLGTRDKLPFSNLHLKKCVVESAKLETDGCTDQGVENAIKIWLKHAPGRIKKQNIKH